MAPKMTPFPLRTTAKASAAAPARWHSSKIITTIVIGILLLETQQTAAEDVEVSSTWHRYDDNENSIYHDEEGNRIKANSTSIDTSTTNTNIIEMPEVFTCPAEGLYAHNYECQLYYRCETQTNGYIKAYLLNCKKGTIFSRDLKLCMPTMLANREECQQYINEIDTLATDDNIIAGATAAIAAGAEDHRQGVYYGGYGGDVINSSVDDDGDDSIDTRLMQVLNEAKVKGGIANNGNAMDGAYNHWQNYGLTGLSGVSVISFSTSSARSAGVGGISSSTDNDQGPPCEDDGFMSDPHDCTVFYRCISNGHTFNKIGFRCSDGTAWDDSLQSCNHLFNVRANGGCQAKQDIQMDELNNQQTSAHSSQSNFQNATMSSSSSQQNSSSSSSSSSSSTSATSQQSSTQSSSTENTSSSSNNQQSSNSSVGNSNIQSSSSQGNNSSSQNSNSNENANAQNASNNSEQQTSGSSAHNNNQQSSNSQQNSNSNTQNSNNNNQQNSNTNTSSQTSNGNQNSNSQSSSDSSNNQQSTNNNEQSSSNQTTNQTSQNASSNSQNNNQQNSTSSNSNNTQSTSSNSQGNNNSTSSNSSSNQPSSSECVDENTYLPDKQDCAKFYRCRDNGNGLEIVPFTCGPGTIWNQDDKVCDLPTNSQLEKCKTISAGQEQSSSSSNNSNNNNSSNNQSTSDNGQSSSINNQSETTNNQTGTSSNNNNQSVSATSQSESSSNDNNQSNSSNNQSSSSSNSNNQSTSSSSQSGSSSNSASNNQSGATSNTNNQSGSNNQSSGSQSNNNSQPGSSNNEQQSSTEQQSPGPQKPSNPNGKCENSETYLQDKYDCARFYRCVDNGNGGFNHVGFDCAPGTVWDPDAKGCNHPTDVQKEECKVMANNISSGASAGNSNNQNNQSSATNSENNQSSSSNQQESSTISGSASNQGSSSTASSSNNDNQSSSSTQGTNSQSGSSSSNAQSESNGSTTTTSESNQSSSSNTANQESNSQGSSSSTSSSNNNNESGSSNQSSSQSSSSSSSSGNNQSQGSNNESTSSTASSSNNNESSSSNQSSSSSQQGSSNTNTTESNNSSSSSTQNQSSSNSSSSQANNGQASTTQKPFKPATHCESEETFLDDKEDCNKFYRCIDDGKGGFKKVSFKCPPNTVWNPPANSCDHPAHAQGLKCKMTSSGQNSTGSNNQESSSSGTTESGASQSSGSSNNQQSSSTAGSNTEQSNSNQSASSSSQSGSSSSSNNQSSGSSNSSSTAQESSNSQSETQGSESSSSTTTVSSTQESTSTSSTQSPQQSGNQGSASSSVQQNPVGICNNNNQYLEDSKDCAKFYRCVKNSKGGYDKIAFTCGPGTVWDSQIDGCNHAWAVKNKKCGTNLSSGSASGTESGTQQTTTKPTTQRPPTSTSSKPAEEKPTSSSPVQRPTTLKPAMSKPTATQKPTVDPSQTHDICKSEGFTKDPSDCSRFYRCVENGNGGFIQYSFRCGQGTVWDEDLQTCNHDLNKCNPNTDDQSSSTQKPQQITTTGPGYLPPSQKPDTTTTSKPGYQPTSQKPQEVTTSKPGYQPTTEIPQQTTQKPEYESTTQSTPETTTLKPGHTTEPAQESTTKKPAYPTSTQSPQDTTTTKPGYQPSTTTKYPDSTTSEKYPESTTQYHTTTIKPNPNEPISHSDKCSKEGFFGDTQDCQKFYRCVEHVKGSFEKHSFKCGNNTVWDAKIESCNHPSEVADPQCRIETSTEIGATKPSTTYKPTNMPTESIQTGDLTTTMQPTSTTPIPNLPPGKKCQGEGFMADPDNCRKFYRCEKTGNTYSKHEFMCAEGTGWSEEKQTCDRKDIIESCQGQMEKPETTTMQYTSSKPTTSTVSETTKKPESTTSTLTTTTTSHETTTSSIGKPTTTEYPPTTLNPPTTETSTTTESTSTTPIPNLPPGKNCNGEGFMADPEDCRKFYRCEKTANGYLKHDFNCSRGTGWNEDKQTCDHRANIDRCKGQTEEPEIETTTIEYTTNYEKPSTTTSGYEKPTSTNDYEKPTTTTPYLTTTVHPTTTTSSSTTTDYTTTMQTTSSKPVASLPPGKICNAEGFMADPDNCRKFYRCEKSDNGYSKHEFMCSKGTGWSKEKQTCDHRDKIDHCQGQTEEPDVETTTIEYTTSKPTSTPSLSTTTDFDKPTISTTSQKPSTTVQTTESSTTSTDSPFTTTDYTTTTVSSTTYTDSPSTTTEYTTTIQPTSTTPVPNQPAGKKCKGEGFMADPDDCRKFYRCTASGGNLEQHEFMCGNGTGWSEDKQTCDHAANIKRCEGQKEEMETSTIATETTTYKPTDSTTMQTTAKPVETTTKPTTTEQTTDKPGYVPTTTTASTSRPEQETTNSPTTTEITTSHPTTMKPTDKPGYEPTTTENSSASTTTDKYESTTMEPINHTCTSEGFFADADDCNRYYRCVETDKKGSYQIYSFRCPNGTVWDTSLETCNYADKVSGNCSSGATTTEYPTTIGLTTTENDKDSTTTEKAETTTEIPKENSTMATTLPTTTEIPKETTTSGTTPETATTTEAAVETTTMKPPEITTTEAGTDKPEITTDDPKDTTTMSPPLESTTADKPLETTEMSKDTTTTTKPETTTIEPNVVETTTQPATSNNNTAPCPPTSEGQNLYICPTGFRRHPKHCSMFYQCTEKADSYDQSIVVFKCPNGTVYHEDLNRCDEPKPDENCSTKSRTQATLFEEEYKHSHMIQIRSSAPLCPAEGHFALNNDECGQLFVKCQFSAQTLRTEGQIFRCPKGFTYWSVSRRCERTQKLQNCATTKYDVSSSIPVEWSNIGNRRRNLKF